MRDSCYVQDGLEISESEPMGQVKVLLSSCSLASSVANESARDVFERAIRASNVDKVCVDKCDSQIISSIAIMPWRNRYWFADLQQSEKISDTAECNSVCLSKNESEWAKGQIVLTHNTYGHCGWEKAAEMAGVKIPVKWTPFCRICAATKLHRANKKKKRQESDPGKHAGDYLHVDLHGKVRDVTHNGMKYFAIIVDDFSGRIFALLLKRKKHIC